MGDILLVWDCCAADNSQYRMSICDNLDRNGRGRVEVCFKKSTKIKKQNLSIWKSMVSQQLWSGRVYSLNEGQRRMFRLNTINKVIVSSPCYMLAFQGNVT